MAASLTDFPLSDCRFPLLARVSELYITDATILQRTSQCWSRWPLSLRVVSLAWYQTRNNLITSGEMIIAFHSSFCRCPYEIIKINGVSVPCRILSVPDRNQEGGAVERVKPVQNSPLFWVVDLRLYAWFDVSI